MPSDTGDYCRRPGFHNMRHVSRVSCRDLAIIIFIPSSRRLGDRRRSSVDISTCDQMCALLRRTISYWVDIFLQYRNIFGHGICLLILRRMDNLFVPALASAHSTANTQHRWDVDSPLHARRGNEVAAGSVDLFRRFAPVTPSAFLLACPTRKGRQSIAARRDYRCCEGGTSRHFLHLPS